MLSRRIGGATGDQPEAVEFKERSPGEKTTVIASHYSVPMKARVNRTTTVREQVAESTPVLEDENEAEEDGRIDRRKDILDDLSEEPKHETEGKTMHQAVIWSRVVIFMAILILLLGALIVAFVWTLSLDQSRWWAAGLFIVSALAVFFIIVGVYKMDAVRHHFKKTTEIAIAEQEEDLNES